MTTVSSMCERALCVLGKGSTWRGAPLSLRGCKNEERESCTVQKTDIAGKR